MFGKCKEVRLEGGDLAPEAVLFAASLWCPPPVGLDRNARGLSGSSPRSVLIKIFRGYAVIPGVDIRCHAFSHISTEL